MNAHKLTLTVCLSVMVVACGGLPQPKIPDTVGVTNTDADSPTQSQTLAPNPPVLSVHAETVGYNSVPIFGQAEKSTDANSNNVIVEGGLSTTAAAVSTSGSFCADVPLKQGANNLSFYVQRSDDSQSPKVSLTITYDPSAAAPPDDSGTTGTSGTSGTGLGSVQDQARGRAAGSDPSPDNAAAMTDGDDTTIATFTSYPSIYLDLGTTYQIQKIEIVWGDDASGYGEFADDYDVLTSLQAAPTTPMDTSTAGWSTIASVSGASGGNGDGDLDTFTFGSSVSARWVGITVNSNDTSWYSFDYSVTVASIRVFAPEILPSSGGGSGGPPTCENTAQF